jgi:nucleoside-diphosphate-sugar epimerase
VVGTENVIDACLMNGVKRLVFTSSPSVVFDNRDQSGVGESEPYPRRFLSYYPQTKALAEQAVLKANSNELATVSLRPHLIWGPGDNHLIPRIVSRAKAGKLRIVGNGENLVDTVYIDNAVDAHVLALERLSSGSPISGKAYFITNGEPLPMATIINKVLKAADLPPVTKKIPAQVAYAAGASMELLYWLMKRREEPLLTRFVVRELSCAHWFDITAARQDLGYEPKVSIDEGMQRLRDWLLQKEGAR